MAHGTIAMHNVLAPMKEEPAKSGAHMCTQEVESGTKPQQPISEFTSALERREFLLYQQREMLKSHRHEKHVLENKLEKATEQLARLCDHRRTILDSDGDYHRPRYSQLCLVRLLDRPT